MCTPSSVGKPRFRVSSRRNAIFSSTKWQVSQAPVLEPADVMQVAPSGRPSAPTAVSGMSPFGAAGSGALITGLNDTFVMAFENSCSTRKSSSAG